MASESTSSQQSQQLIPSLKVTFRAIIFSDLTHKLQNRKKNKEMNIFYTRFLSLIFEKLLGGNYVSNDLTLVKPHTITTASFQKPLASEVPLTSRMLKVAKLFEKPEHSLIPPSEKVNVDDGVDKFLSETTVQPVTQPKAPTDLKTKKKRISSSSKPTSPYKVRVILPKKQVVETQHAEVTVATTDATKSLVASELAEEQVNQPLTVEAEKRMAILNLITNSQSLSNKFMYILDQNVKEDVKDAGFVAMEEVTFEQIMDEVETKTQNAQENDESPYENASEIKIIKSYQAATISSSLFIHQSSSYDQDVIDITPKDAKEGDASKSLSGLRSMPGTETLHASIDKPAQSDPLGHLHEELCLLYNKLHGLLSDALKDTLPQLIKEPIKRSVSESVTEELPQVEA
ncbi:hypothetical protein Tco_0393660 [Tanacetum coccineum]